MESTERGAWAGGFRAAWTHARVGRRWAAWSAGAVLLGLGALAACEENDTRSEDPGVLLEAAIAKDQPRDPRNGVTVLVSAQGGTSLLVETENGTHLAPGSTGPARTSCLNVVNAHAQYLLVKPDDTEAVMRLSLFDAPNPPRCEGTALRGLLLPVTTPAAAPTSDATDASDAADASDGEEAGGEEASTSDADADGSDGSDAGGDT